MKDDLLDLNGKDLKNDFERFMYHDHMTFTYLESIVENWEPKNKSYKKLKELVTEFLEYYTRETNQIFPNNRLGILESTIAKDKDIFFKTR